MFLMCGFVIALSGGVAAEVIDKILAFLDDELILLSEVRECAAKPVTRIVANLDQSSDEERDALDYLIEQRLLQREISYLAFPRERERIMSLVMEYLSSAYYDGNRQSLEQQLQQQGFSGAVLEQELELYMKGMDYIRRKYRFNADSNDPEVALHLFQQWMNDLKAKAEIHTKL